MLTSFLQKSRLSFMETVVLAAQDCAAADRDVAHRMTFAIQMLKASSCLESGRPADMADQRTCSQLAQSLEPEEADYIGNLFLAQAGELKSKGKTVENLACGVVAAAYVARSLSAFPKVKDRAQRLSDMVDQVELGIRANTLRCVLLKSGRVPARRPDPKRTTPTTTLTIRRTRKSSNAMLLSLTRVGAVPIP